MEDMLNTNIKYQKNKENENKYVKFKPVTNKNKYEISTPKNNNNN
jgi:hypothetical protein